MRRLLAPLALSLAAAPAHALTPEELFARISPSVWFVYGADASDRRLTQGSGVVIGPQRMITNCHVLRNSATIFVRKDNVLYIAKVEHRDTKRDLCQLQIANFTAPAVRLGTSKELKVGQKVYALGNPKGLEVTLSDGLVSALRGPDGVEPIIQTTAPMSPGSSGGGLFDDDARLVGITTLQRPDGQNLNFALPVEWVAEIPERIKLAEEEAAASKKKREEQVASLRASGVAYSPASTELPAVGATWRYRFVDHKYSNSQSYTVRVTGVEGWNVTETFQLDGGGDGRQRIVVGADEKRFTLHKLAAERLAMEFSPYMLARGDEAMRAPWMSRTTNYPGNQTSPYLVTTRVFGEDNVSVPGGSYKAVRVDVAGRRENIPSTGMTTMSVPSRFLYQAWYSQDARRFVRVRHQQWNLGGSIIGDETLELLSYKVEEEGAGR